MEVLVGIFIILCGVNIYLTCKHVMDARDFSAKMSDFCERVVKFNENTLLLNKEIIEKIKAMEKRIDI